jgi:hypothetical protein
MRREIFREDEDAPLFRLAENFGCLGIYGGRLRGEPTQIFRLLLRHKLLLCPRQIFLRLARQTGFPEEALEVLRRNDNLDTLVKEPLSGSGEPLSGSREPLSGSREGEMDSNFSALVVEMLDAFRAAAIMRGMPEGVADELYDLVAELLGASQVRWLSIPDQKSFLAGLLRQAAEKVEAA